MPKSKKHSEEYFDDARDLWWDRAHFDLMISQWRLGKNLHILDVGSGQGHLTELLCSTLEEKVLSVTCLDYEQQWLDKAKNKLSRFKNIDFKFIQGDAHKIQLPDESFDFVCCQTLLMHLKDPMKSLREMIRVLKPHGRISCFEPNNMINYISFDDVFLSHPADVCADIFKFWLLYSLGKKNLGEGDNIIGEKLPEMLSKLDISQITISQNIKCAPLFPPYDGEQQAWIKQYNNWFENGTGPFSRDELKRYVMAGGGDKNFFEKIYKIINDDYMEQARRIKSKIYSCSGGSSFYIATGIKN